MEETRDTEQTDEALALLSLKNIHSYDVLVNRHREALLRFIFQRFTRDRFQAEDVGQDTFMRAYLSLATFDQTKKFKTWLYAIAINAARSALRKHTPEDIESYANVLCSDSSPEQHVQVVLERGQLAATLECLELNHKLILDMHYLQELTYAEISAALGLKLSTVKTRIFRAKQQLRVHFKPYGPHYGASL